MIVVSGGAEDTIEQTTFGIGRRLVCMGGTSEEGLLVEEQGAVAFKATTYEEYREAAQRVYEVPDIQLVYSFEVAAEEDWEPSPEDFESWYDPMPTVAGLSIPVFAVYGDMDKNIDPFQGFAAYEAAIAGGHELSRVELLPGIGHTMRTQRTGCLGEPAGNVAARYLELLDEWIALLA